MHTIKETIIVEGIYDKIKLSGFINGIIITTGGFTVYRNKALVSFIKKMAAETGIVIFTDSDSAGFRIRNFIKQSVTYGTVLHAYAPDIKGKERRKSAPGKEGLLGVEGMSEGVVLESLKKAGCTIDGIQSQREAGTLTKASLMKLGLAGCKNSRENRARLCAALDLPEKLSANMLIDVLNRLNISDEDFLKKLLTNQIF